MSDVVVIEVPFDGYGRPGNQARTPRALREAGLLDLPGTLRATTTTLDLPPPTPERGRDTSLINEPALLAVVEGLRREVGTALADGRTPLVVGGDCTTLLGIVPALGDRIGAAAVLVLDGHEDTMPLDVSEDGEAANAELGLLLGVTGRLLRGPLAATLPALEAPGLAVLGHRDDRWRRSFNVGSLAGLGVHSRPLGDIRDDPAAAGRDAADHLRATADRWWLHIDVDVLDPEELPAQGLPDVVDEPDGLTWEQLHALTAAAVAVGGCVGLSHAVYDPDQDPDRAGARRLVALTHDLLERMGES